MKRVFLTNAVKPNVVKNPGLEVRARTNGTSRSEDCALSTQPNPQLQNRWFMVNFRRKLFQSTQNTTDDVDNGHSKECRSFDVDLHCKTFKIRSWTEYTQVYGGAGAIAPEHAAVKRGYHRFFFCWSEKKGVRPHPPNPLGYVPGRSFTSERKLCSHRKTGAHCSM